MAIGGDNEGLQSQVTEYSCSVHALQKGTWQRELGRLKESMTCAKNRYLYLPKGGNFLICTKPGGVPVNTDQTEARSRSQRKFPVEVSHALGRQ